MITRRRKTHRHRHRHTNHRILFRQLCVMCADYYYINVMEGFPPAYHIYYLETFGQHFNDALKYRNDKISVIKLFNLISLPLLQSICARFCTCCKETFQLQNTKLSEKAGCYYYSLLNSYNFY